MDSFYDELNSFIEDTNQYILNVHIIVLIVKYILVELLLCPGSFLLRESI